jgi:hypothetical protein
MQPQQIELARHLYQAGHVKAQHHSTEEAFTMRARSMKRRTVLGTVGLLSAMILSLATARPAIADEHTYNPPGGCSAFTVSGFEYYGAGSSGVRDSNNDCSSMTPQVTWNSALQGTNRTYCSATTTNYKRCVGSGDWRIAHGLTAGTWYHLRR